MPPRRPTIKLLDVPARLARIEAKLDRLLTQTAKGDMRVTKEVAELKAAVERQTTVEAGVEVIIRDGVGVINALLDKIASSEDLAEIKSLTQEVSAHTTALEAAAKPLGEAVVAGTGAGEPPAPEVPPASGDETV